MQEQDLLMLILALSVLILGALPVVFFVYRKKQPLVKDETARPEIKSHLDKSEIVSTEKKVVERKSLVEGLSKGRLEIWGKLGNLLAKSSPDHELVEEMEEVLYGADLGPTMVIPLLEKMKVEAKRVQNSPQEAKKVLYQFLSEKMFPIQSKIDADKFTFHPNSGTQTIMIVGINGVGKTTTVGKLAHHFTSLGAKVVVGAADTFRAAAVDQLQIWCDRSGATLVRGKEEADPSGVAFEALKKAQEMKADFCLIDTAGRLHTNKNLMAELLKVKKVLAKLDQKAPQETLLVLDAITGINGLGQAKEFHQCLELSGVIFTKCDGSAKAGSAVSIVDQLGVPMVFIGVGEGINDLRPFSQNEYLDALLGMQDQPGV